MVTLPYQQTPIPQKRRTEYDHEDGISAGGAADDKVVPLSFDMSHVMPQLVWDWVRAFCALTAQEHSWTDITLTKLALDTRNIIAVGARATPEVVSGLEQWIRVAKPC
ncbi:hypothetical protein IQ288_31360 [Burkholderia sp. R-69980]|nr:hypothetical protein [Burkholderia sp. R-69980]